MGNHCQAKVPGTALHSHCAPLVNSLDQWEGAGPLWGETESSDSLLLEWPAVAGVEQGVREG